MAADVRQWRSFRYLDFIPFEAVLYRASRHSFALLFVEFAVSNLKEREGGRGMVNGSMVKIGRRGVATNGIFWVRIYSGE